MSGFFGIFRPQGGPVDLEAFEQMRKATEREGFDGLETHVEEKIAMGHLMLRVSPESKYDKQPLKSDCGNYVLVGHFRLDYRDELGDKLGLTQSELELTPDSKLVMLAYIKWNEKCVHHIEGDWVFVLYNCFASTIFLAKDKSGTSALFYSKQSNLIIFSSSINVLSKIDNIQFSINLFEFYRISIPGIGISSGATLLEDVYCLENSQMIVIDNFLNVKKQQYWELPTTLQLRFKFTVDYVAGLSSAFSQAIKSRLKVDGQVGLFLSSGYDSVAVASFASSELKLAKRKLNSYTSYPLHLNQLNSQELKFSDERPVVSKLSNHLKNVDNYLLNQPKVEISDILKSDLIESSFFPIITYNSYWLQGIFKSASKGGLKYLLNGQMGNFTISSSAEFLVSDYLLKFKFIKLIKILHNLKKIKIKSYYTVTKEYLIKPIYFQLKSFFKGKIFFKKKYFENYRFLTVPQKYKLLFKKIKYGNELFIGNSYIKSSRSLRIAQIKKNITFAGMIWYELGHAHAIVNSDPTSDNRLIQYTLLMPEELYFKDGEQKYIYKKMMNVLIPNEIMNSLSGRYQSYDLPLRLIGEKGIKSLVNELCTKNDLDFIFNLEIIKELYEKIVSSVRPQKTRSETAYLLMCISLFNFTKSKLNSNFILNFKKNEK